MTLVSGNIRFVPIFEGFIGERTSNDSGVIKNMDFHGFHRYVFSTLRKEASVIMRYYLIPFRLSTAPKYMTLGDSEWLECSLYVTILRSAFESFSSYLFTVDCF